MAGDGRVGADHQISPRLRRSRAPLGSGLDHAQHRQLEVDSRISSRASAVAVLQAITRNRRPDPAESACSKAHSARSSPGTSIHRAAAPCHPGKGTPLGEAGAAMRAAPSGRQSPESNTPIFKRPAVTDVLLPERQRPGTRESDRRARRACRLVAHPQESEPERSGENWRAACR